ncbi:hypothetical protein Bca52824_040172 [Brassica carinata]|uniref:Prolamin-like domain-containing protein n=1 Tax=Brassica carinata TaxID=52824 RepID=A0A8X7RSY4_BRACI|nr:hypothetical protein Bca52824_040172 [Brassica carinata]
MVELGVSAGIDKNCCGAIGLIVKECWSVIEHCGFQAEKPVLSPRAPSPETLVLSLV